MITRRKRLVWSAAIVAVLACAVVAERRRRRAKKWQTWAAICNYLEAFRHASDITVDMARGIKAYIAGDTAEVPRSLVQALQLAASRPVVQAVTQSAASGESDSHSKSALSSVIDGALSDRGQNLLALVASVSTTRAASILCAQLAKSSGSSKGSYERALAWLASPAAQQLLSRCVVDFVTAGVGQYCAATIHINPYQQMLEAAAQPQHARVLQQLTRAACYASVQAYMQADGSSDDSHTSAHQGDVTLRGGIGRDANSALCTSSDGALLQPHPHVAAATNGKAVNGDAAAQHSSGIDSWMQSWAAACMQPAFRDVCVASAQSASAGAIQALCHECKDTRVAQALTHPYVRHVAVAGLVLWMVVLPLALLYATLARSCVI